MSYNLETGELIDVRKEWVKEWVGMPSFNPETKKEFATVIVRLETEEDFNNFCAKMEQKINLTPDKPKSIWFPKLNQDETIERFF